MKKRNKAFFALTLLISASLSLTSAATAATSQNGSVNGYSTNGSLSMGSNNAVASTSISGVSAGLTVSVTYTYGWGAVINRYTVSNSASAGSTYVSTVAPAGHVNPVSISASGSHGVYSGSQSWTASTST